MANLKETATWENGIYQLETSDPVLGGENGIDNKAPRQLANRTLYLKTELEKTNANISSNQTNTTTELAKKANNTVSITAGNGLTGGGNLTANRTMTLGTPSTITASSTNSVTSTSHTHAISKATTGAAGIVQLYDGLTGEYTDRALTAAQGKALNDKITAAQNTLSNAVLTTGDQAIDGKKTFSKELIAGNVNYWPKVLMPVLNGSHWAIETNPNSSLTEENSVKLNFKFELDASNRRYIYFPAINQNETVAYQSLFKNIPHTSGLDLDTTTQTQFFKNAKNGYPTAENGGHEVGNENSGFIVGWSGECMQFVNAGNRLFIRGADIKIEEPNAWTQWARVLTTEIGLLKTDIVIATGTINDGETIPLPKGFTQEQCKWFVSITDTDKAIEAIEGFSSVSYNFTATADSNRVVTSKIIYSGYQKKSASCQASYIIIGKK